LGIATTTTRAPEMAGYGGYDGYNSGMRSAGSLKQSERSRWTPLTRMLLSGEMTQERQKELTPREKFDRWMVNEGYRRM
jgi:NADPH oxidase